MESSLRTVDCNGTTVLFFIKILRFYRDSVPNSGKYWPITYYKLFSYLSFVPKYINFDCINFFLKFQKRRSQTLPLKFPTGFVVHINCSLLLKSVLMPVVVGGGGRMMSLRRGGR